MITIGLTGSIGMGKSTVGAMFADLGAAIWDADSAVHRLYAKGGEAVDPISQAFPDAIIDDQVDRPRLAKIVLGDPGQLRALEAIIHPLVAQDRLNFLQEAGAAGAKVIVLDIPLLFENQSEGFFDTVVVVSASKDVQRARVLERPGMSEEKFEQILAQQMPDADKRAKADFVIRTDVDLSQTRMEVEKVFTEIKKRFPVQ